MRCDMAVRAGRGMWTVLAVLGIWLASSAPLGAQQEMKDRLVGKWKADKEKTKAFLAKTDAPQEQLEELEELPELKLEFAEKVVTVHLKFGEEDSSMEGKWEFVEQTGDATGRLKMELEGDETSTEIEFLDENSLVIMPEDEMPLVFVRDKEQAGESDKAAADKGDTDTAAADKGDTDMAAADEEGVDDEGADEGEASPERPEWVLKRLGGRWQCDLTATQQLEANHEFESAAIDDMLKQVETMAITFRKNGKMLADRGVEGTEPVEGDWRVAVGVEDELSAEIAVELAGAENRFFVLFRPDGSIQIGPQGEPSAVFVRKQ